MATSNNIDPELLAELYILAAQNTEEGREAAFYLRNRNELEGEWILDYGWDNGSEVCFEKQQMLKKLMTLCLNIACFETYFKKAWQVKYEATCYDQGSLRADTLMFFTSTQHLVSEISLSKNFKAQIQNLSFETFFLRTAFDLIAQQLLGNKFTIAHTGWNSLITLALHRTQGYKISLLLKAFNFKAISTKRDFVLGTFCALESWSPEGRIF